MADMISPLEALSYVQQQGEMGRARGQQNQLAKLYSQSYSAPPEQQNALLGQIAAINPQAAQAQQQNFQGQEDRRMQKLAGAARYLEQARQTQNPQAVQGAWNAVRPVLQQEMPQGQFPEQWDDATMAPTLYQVLAQTGGGTQGQVQSTYVDAQGNRVAIMRNGSTQVLGQDNPKMQIIDTGDGFYGVNKGTLQAAPVSTRGGSTAAAMPTEADMNADAQIANEMIAAGIPEAQVDAFLTARGQRAISMQQPAADNQLRKAPAAITPYQQAQLGMDSQRLDIQRQSAEDARVAREEAASTRRMMNEQKARQAQQAIDTRQAALNNVNRGIERVRNALQAVDSTITGSGPIAQYGTRYREAGQELESAVGAMQNSMLALTRVPGVGSQSDLEARIANLIYPSLDRNSQVNQNTLKNLEQFARDLGGTARQADEEDRKAAQQPAAAPSSAQSGGVDDLLSKYGVR